MNTDSRSRLMGRLSRILGLIVLLLALYNAARLLGVSDATDPIVALGALGFVYLAVFTIAQFFAAVGLWIQSSWGAVVLIGAMVTELGLALTGNPNVHLAFFGIVVRLLLLLGAAAILSYVQWRLMETIHD